jgi:NAD(P)H dehydrogenase (quinone)
MNVVFGAFGRTGRHVASSLERVGQPVRRVTRSAPRAHAGEVAVARLTHEAELGAALRGARAVYAILPDDLRAARFRAERRAMAEALTRAIVRENVPRVVLLSSAVAALGERGQNGFGVELAYFERLLLETRANLTILRASYFQDNVAEMLPRAAQDGVYPNFFASRERLIPTIAASDVGAIAANCLLEEPTNAREIVDLSGPSYSPLDMARIAGETLGQPLTVLEVPAAAREEAFCQWMSPEAARAMVETIDCVGSARADAPGDRALRGATPLRQVLLASLVQSASVAPEVRP